MTVFIKEEINFGKCVEKLLPIFPERTAQEIESAFRSFFWADERSAHWVYNDSQASTQISEIVRDFVAENQNESQFHAEIAIALQMPIAPAKVSEYSSGYWL